MRQSLVCLAILSAVFANGQTTNQPNQSSASIYGVVTDPQGKGVPGANVALYPRGGAEPVNTTAGASGDYRFDGLEPGAYLIEARAPGFARFTKGSVTVERGAQTTEDIALQLDSASEQVSVTASGTAQTPDEISKSVTVVDHSEIEQRDDATIADALRTVPGLRVQQLGGLGGLTSIKTRGLRNEDTAILFDGLRFRDVTSPQADASGFIQDFVDTDIDRVEVLRGTGSSIYGTDAIGGAINLISADGGGRTRGSVLVEGGALGTFRGKAEMAGGALDNRLQYSGGLTHLNVTQGVGGDEPARITSGQGRVSYQLTPGIQLVARMYAADSLSAQTGEPQAVGNIPATGIVNAVPLALSQMELYQQGASVSQLNTGNATYLSNANDPDSTRAARFLAGAFILNGHPSATTGYSLTYQGVNTWSDFGNGPAGVGYQPVGGNTHSVYDGTDQVLSVQGNTQLTRFTLLNGGYEFEKENYENLSLQPQSIGNSRVDATEHSNAVWVQDQARLFDGRLMLAASVRAQFFHLTEPQFSPTASAPYAGVQVPSPPNAYTGDASVAWFFRKTGTKIRGHAGRGYRAPSLYERFGTYFDPIYGYSVYGDPRLGPDRSTAFDGGIDQDFWNGRLHASATYFYTRLENEILFDFSGLINPATDPYGRYGGYLNTLGGLSRGVESSVTVAPTRTLNVTAAYTYTNSQQRTPIAENIFQSYEIPDHQVSLVATQSIGSRFYVNFDLVASSNYLAPIYSPVDFLSRVFRFPGIHTADLGASYRLPLSEFRAVRFFGRIANLFDQNYYEAGFRTAGIGAYGGAQFEF